VDASFEIPIVLLVFNRPELTARVLEQVRIRQPSLLFVVADGPRPGRTGDEAKCAAVRAVVERGVDWPCEVVSSFADQNLGCARRVSSGISGVFERVDEAIILEDDCIPDPLFFPFCAELLKKYRQEPRIAAISGSNFQAPRWRSQDSYYFSRYPHCWGWATWRRAWADFDPGMARWAELRGKGWLREWLEDDEETAYWTSKFDDTAAGEIDTWAYPWTFSCWVNGRLTVLPKANLVLNVGAGDDATHAHLPHRGVKKSSRRVTFPLRHPNAIVRNRDADTYTFRNHFRPPSPWRQTLQRLRHSWHRVWT
jgi:hypothetical protein